MPVYPFLCLECGNKFDEFHSMADAPLEVPCKCGQKAYRNWNDYGKTDALMQENIRYSWSLGIPDPSDPKQVAAFHKKYPGAEFRKDTGQMKVHNRQEKLLRMKQAGMEEY